MESKVYPFCRQYSIWGTVPLPLHIHTYTCTFAKKFNTFSIIFQKSEPPVNKGAPVAVLIVKWTGGTFEFDQL